MLPTLQQDDGCKQPHQCPFRIFTFSLATITLRPQQVAFRTATAIMTATMCTVGHTYILGYHNFVLSCALSVSPFLHLLVHHLVLLFHFFLLLPIFFDSSFSLTLALRLVLKSLLSSSSSLLPVHLLLYQSPFSTGITQSHSTAMHTNKHTKPNPLQFARFKSPPLMATTKQSQFQEVA